MTELALLLALAVAVVLWVEGRRVQEIAVARCRLACETAGVQFLDGAAPIERLRLTRDRGGSLRWRRLFSFDYGTPTGERRRGTIEMLGRTPVALALEEQMVFDADTDDERSQKRTLH